METDTEPRTMRSIRLRDDEWLAFQQAAKLVGVPTAAWMRMQLRLIAADQLTRARRPVPFLISEESRP